VIGQVAVSVILLVGASLLTRTLIGLIRNAPGFDPRNLAVVTLEVPRWKYPDGQARRAFYQTLDQQVQALPGVIGATVNGGAPPDAGGFRIGPSIEIEGKGVVVNDPKQLVPFSSIGPEYFSVMGVPLKAGRTFDDSDAQGATPTIVINERMAERVWNGANPVGQRVKIGSGPQSPWYTVVGVVGDVYQFDYAETKGVPTYYLPVSQSGVAANQTLVVRTSGDASRILPLLRQAIRAIDPDQPIWRIGTMDERYANFFALPRFYTFLLTTFAALGVVIAAVGLYGVLSYAIASRTRELGIRLALGAQRSSVWWLVLRNGALVTAIGLAAGIAGSFVLTRSLSSMLIGVPRVDPVSYSAVIVLLGAIAFAACWIPARCATQVDPVVALRAE
jgi:predicted permease